MRTYDVSRPTITIDWTKFSTAQDSIFSTTTFLQDNPMISDMLGITIDQAFSGRDPVHLSAADREAFWKKLTAAHRADEGREP